MKDNLDSLSVDIQNVLSVSYIIDSIQSKRGGKTRKFLEQERIIYPRPPKITKVLNNKELMEKLFVEYISEFHNDDIKKTTNEILQTILSDYKMIHHTTKYTVVINSLFVLLLRIMKSWMARFQSTSKRFAPKLKK